MTTLATLVGDFDSVYAALEANDGELTPELGATLGELNLDERTKVDRVIYHLKGLEGECDSLKKLEDEIAAKRKTKARQRESLLGYVRWYMAQRKAEKLFGEVFRFQIVRSGKPPVEVLVPPEELPYEWVTITVAPNKEAIRRDLEHMLEGASTTMARLGEPTETLRIY